MDSIRKVTEDLAAAYKAYMEAARLFQETTGIAACVSDWIQLVGNDLNDKDVEEFANHLGVEVIFRRNDDATYKCKRRFSIQGIDFLWVNNKEEENHVSGNA